MAQNGLTLLLAFAGGVFNGTFPVFIKTPRVLAARVHPVVFQLYKSTMVFLTGVVLIGVRVARCSISACDQPAFSFTWWAVASAVAWVPSGVCTIIAVPLIGVGSAVLTTSATGSTLSFFVFWLVFHEKVKRHEIWGHEIVIAPIYLACSLVGMAGLIAAQYSTQRAPPVDGRDALLDGADVASSCNTWSVAGEGEGAAGDGAEGVGTDDREKSLGLAIGRAPDGAKPTGGLLRVSVRVRVGVRVREG